MTKKKNTYSFKKKRTYPLKDIKKLIKTKNIFPAGIRVIQDANDLCLTIGQAYEEILKLEPKDFYKSGTEPYNQQVWQDTYKKEIKGVLSTFLCKFLVC
ncbi:MAG: type II toxin-antitoxin system MqsR family toxin [Deltaproteobacteria bacterium]|nr:type II toxin-antitoxin system MqsR family toxin [Deltaproteobacteria bacterium]